MTAPKFVIDNSVVMSWCYEGEASAYAQSVLEALVEGAALVPAIWPLEVGNALLVGEWRHRITQAEVIRFLNILSSLSISVEQESPDRMLKEIIALAKDHQLSTYDASYLDLAMRTGLPLATQDEALLKAAKKCRAPLFGAAFRRKHP